MDRTLTLRGAKLQFAGSIAVASLHFNILIAARVTGGDTKFQKPPR